MSTGHTQYEGPTPQERERARQIADFQRARAELALMNENAVRVQRLLTGLHLYGDDAVHAAVNLTNDAETQVRYARLLLERHPLGDS